MCPAAQVPTTGLPEVQGVSAGAEMWMLFFTPLPIPPQKPVKIVVRMTGHGALQMWAVGPAATQLQPEDMTEHTGSNWNGPGGEWGTLWDFPHPGCWRLHAERGGVTGTLDVMVEA